MVVEPVHQVDQLGHAGPLLVGPERGFGDHRLGLLQRLLGSRQHLELVALDVELDDERAFQLVLLDQAVEGDDRHGAGLAELGLEQERGAAEGGIHHELGLARRASGGGLHRDGSRIGLEQLLHERRGFHQRFDHHIADVGEDAVEALGPGRHAHVEDGPGRDPELADPLQGDALGQLGRHQQVRVRLGGHARSPSASGAAFV